MADQPPLVVNAHTTPEDTSYLGETWGTADVVLTPGMRPRGGKLGVVKVRVPPHHAACPLHTHQLEDEVFFVLEGRGVLRYGSEPLREIGPGDCISCPAGTGLAHQIGNPFDQDLVYLAIGNREPREVCTYPDSGKVMVRSLGAVGRLEKTDYMSGEAEVPEVLTRWASQGAPPTPQRPGPRRPAAGG